MLHQPSNNQAPFKPSDVATCWPRRGTQTVHIMYLPGTIFCCTSFQSGRRTLNKGGVFFPAAVGPPDRLWECVLGLCSGRTQYSAQSAAVAQEIRLHCHTWLLSLLPPTPPRLVSYTTGGEWVGVGWCMCGANERPFIE